MMRELDISNMDLDEVEEWILYLKEELFIERKGNKVTLYAVVV